MRRCFEPGQSSWIADDLTERDWVINEAALSLMRTVRYGFPAPDAPPPKY